MVLGAFQTAELTSPTAGAKSLPCRTVPARLRSSSRGKVAAAVRRRERRTRHPAGPRRTGRPHGPVRRRQGPRWLLGRSPAVPECQGCTGIHLLFCRRGLRVRDEAKTLTEAASASDKHPSFHEPRWTGRGRPLSHQQAPGTVTGPGPRAEGLPGAPEEKIL